MNSFQKYGISASRLFLGAVFIFSGFVKCVDPLGSVYKLGDYFTAFGMSETGSLAYFLGFLLGFSEFFIGFALMLNLRIKLAIWGVSLFMAFFTPLTFYLALANPVHDCGCFGDALIITNWETFYKNLILLIPTIFLFIHRNVAHEKKRLWEQWLWLFLGFLIITGIEYSAIRHLPMLDFRPYSIGTYIPDGMVIPEGAKHDVYEYEFIYEKDGVQNTFGINNLPDSTWNYVDRKVTLIEKGYEPPIHDFNIRSLDGEEITDEVLNREGYSFLMIAYDLSKTQTKNLEKINRIAAWSEEQDIPFYALTASASDELNHFNKSYNPLYRFYNVDEITLKTIIRANPGIVLIKNGTIVDKWNANDVPDPEAMHQNLMHQSINKYHKSNERKSIWVLFLSLALAVSVWGNLKNRILRNK